MNIRRTDLAVVAAAAAFVWCLLLVLAVGALAVWGDAALLQLNVALIGWAIVLWAGPMLLLVGYLVLHRPPQPPPTASAAPLASERVTALTDVAARIVRGDFSVRADASANDELGGLARSFNQVLDTVINRTQKLDEERARFLASINSLPVGFIMTDAQNNILTFNPAMQGILSVSDADHLDRIQAQLASNESFIRQLMDNSQKVLQSHEPLHMHNVSANKRLYRVFISPVTTEPKPNQHIIGCTVLVEDVTEEQAMNRSKDEFFSLASHELRTPLTAIRGNASILQEYYKKHFKDPEVKAMMADIHESSVRMIAIVNDFLDASRLEQGKMTFNVQPFPFVDTVDAVIRELEPAAKAKSLTLHVTSPLGKLPEVYADQSKVHQVLFNLVDNAIKFTDQGGVTIKAKVEDGHLRFFVIDTGKGMSEEAQRLLFHKFQQGADDLLTRDNTQGTGLGLYISKLILERMGGSIKLEYSEAHNGTAFSCSLPLADAKPAEPKSGTQPPATP